MSAARTPEPDQDHQALNEKLLSSCATLFELRGSAVGPNRHASSEAETGKVDQSEHLSLAVVIPAYNEEAYLGATIQALRVALDYAFPSHQSSTEIIVVDNASTDSTHLVALEHGCRVVREPRTGIAIARNAGAQNTSAEVVLFLDADTIVPIPIIASMMEFMSNSTSAGGAFVADYRPAKRTLRVYNWLWSFYARWRNMMQGVAQFCRLEIFNAIGGYDETIYMGEDNDFYWRLCAYARQEGLVTWVPQDLRVVPSTRRQDQWPLWKYLLLTNPISAMLARRSRSFWRDWYGDRTPR